MTATISERVAAGAKWLDAHVPTWAKEIDVKRLNLADSCRCVLGQLVHGVPGDVYSFSTYLDVARSSPRQPTHDLTDGQAERLGIVRPMTYREAVSRGFHLGEYDEHGSEWRDLTAEWRRVIEERRAK